MLELCLETSALAACRGRTIPVNNRASFRLFAAEGCDFVRHHFCFFCRESFKTLCPGTRAFICSQIFLEAFSFTEINGFLTT